MSIKLDYAIAIPREPISWPDRVYILLVALCYLAALAANIIFPSSPHRFDPVVDIGISLANISASSTAVLFLLGLIRRVKGTLPRRLKTVWKFSGFLIPFLFLADYLHPCGGPFMGPWIYR